MGKLLVLDLGTINSCVLPYLSMGNEPVVIANSVAASVQLLLWLHL